MGCCPNGSHVLVTLVSVQQVVSVQFETRYENCQPVKVWPAGPRGSPFLEVASNLRIRDAGPTMQLGRFRNAFHLKNLPQPIVTESHAS
jgi:hypothetical protein